MSELKFIKPKKINLKNHPTYNEKWIQNHIVEDTTILGLGDDIIVKDEERHQPHAGRLDLLLQDSQNLRYEVEIQLANHIANVNKKLKNLLINLYCCIYFY